MKNKFLTIVVVMLGTALAWCGETHAALLHQWAFEETGTTAFDTGTGTTYNLTTRDVSDSPADMHSASGVGVAGVGTALDLTSNLDPSALGGSVFATASGSGKLAEAPFSALTITGWIKTIFDGDIGKSAFNGSTLMNDQPAYLARQGEGFRFFTRDLNRLRFQVDHASGNTAPSSNEGVLANHNDWTFVAVTWDLSDASGSNVKFYVGSETDAVTAAGTGDITQPMRNTGATQAFFLGRQNSTSNGLPGFMDDFRIYDEALSLSQLEEIRQSAIPEPSAALLAVMGIGIALLAHRRLT